MRISIAKAKHHEGLEGASAHHGSSQVLMEEPQAQARTWSPFVKRFAAVLGISLIVVVVVAVVAFTLHFSPVDPPAATCLDDWIRYGGKCYLFSQAEGNWTTSQSNCSSLGSSLAVIHSQAELEFLKRYNDSFPRWIGLWREPGKPWKWVDGTELNSSLFQLPEDGQCSFLNPHPTISRCHNPMKWICSQPDPLAKQHPNQALC